MDGILTAYCKATIGVIMKVALTENTVTTYGQSPKCRGVALEGYPDYWSSAKFPMEMIFNGCQTESEVIISS